MRHIEVLEPGGADVDEADVYGVSRYLADAVARGEISVEDGASALAEWGDDTTLHHVADRAPGSTIERMLHAAARHAA